MPWHFIFLAIYVLGVHVGIRHAIVVWHREYWKYCDRHPGDESPDYLRKHFSVIHGEAIAAKYGFYACIWPIVAFIWLIKKAMFPRGINAQREKQLAARKHLQDLEERAAEAERLVREWTPGAILAERQRALLAPAPVHTYERTWAPIEAQIIGDNDNEPTPEKPANGKLLPDRLRKEIEDFLTAGATE